MSDDKVQTLKVKRSSRLSGFYRQSPERRRTRLVESRWLARERVYRPERAREILAEEARRKGTVR
ncbi:MAG TPA: hypothetical protein VFZ09_49890 [Archangium sp.]|uniref:hypothetical protein n=1 Tax=Archangium sp. TaxID=1872627 RepID=UPI002E309B7E|nr:hypothetical protein [Archangium sp.]HEX5754395.1 hypothetical protein [Archangium sp.]